MDVNQAIKHVMTAPVITVRPDDTMDKVQRIFDEEVLHHVPVVEEGGRVAGMISKSDYLRLLHGFTLFKARKSEDYNRAILRSLLAHEVMTRQVATLHPDDSLGVAAGYFRENRFHAIPVVDGDSNLVGIVTTYDLITHAYRDTGIAT
jgi:acetoin utilization protein AcuB